MIWVRDLGFVFFSGELEVHGALSGVDLKDPQARANSST
jgi:hypothetical protein